MKKYVLINDPIDCARLEIAFRSANWRWSEGGLMIFPSTEKLERHICKYKAELETRPGPNNCNNSGGICIEWNEGQVIVKLHPKLAQYYENHKDQTDNPVE